MGRNAGADEEMAFRGTRWGGGGGGGESLHKGCVHLSCLLPVSDIVLPKDNNNLKSTQPHPSHTARHNLN